MENIFDYLSKFAPIDPYDERLINKYLHLATFQKETFVQKKGEKADKFYFIRKGLLCEFYTETIENDEIREIITQIESQGRCIYSSVSYHLNQSCHSYIQALEKSHVQFIYKKDLEKLITENPTIETLVRLVSIDMKLREQENNAIFFQQNLELKYQAFLEYRKDLINRLKVKDIASFLRVNSSTLSRFRKKLSSKAL